MTQYNGNQFNILRVLSNDARATGHEVLTVAGATAQKLTVPAGTKYALIEVESSVTSGVVVRYWLDGSNPTTADGIGRSHLTAIDITEYSNLVNFRVIAAQAGTHKLMIQYFSNV